MSTLRCPKCGQNMTERKDLRGDYLQCMVPHCDGKRLLNGKPPAPAPQEDSFGPLVVGPLKKAEMLTRLSAGLATHADAMTMTPEDIVDTAEAMQREILARCLVPQAKQSKPAGRPSNGSGVSPGTATAGTASTSAGPTSPGRPAPATAGRSGKP